MDHTQTNTPSWRLALLIGSVLLAACDPAPSTTPKPVPEPVPEPEPFLNLSFEQTKQFVFDWSPVNNATHYVLEENPDGESDYQVVANNIAADLTQYRHTVPLYQRTRAHYRLLACLPEQTECPLVGETQVSVNNVDQLVNSIGYFKGFALKSGTLKNKEIPLHAFGISLALSEDGTTLAVAGLSMYPVTPGASAYVTNAGAVFVYRRNANGEWQEDQQLQAIVPDEYDYFGNSLSLSADGKTLAVGASGENNDKTGVTMNPESVERTYRPTNYSLDSGAVYLFTRNDADTTSPWHATAYIKDEAMQIFGSFGDSVSLSADGTTLAVGAPLGGTANTNPESAFNLESALERTGTVNLYRLSDSATWQFVQTVQAENAQSSDRFGISVSLDANGTGLAVAARGARAIYLFTRTGELWQLHQRLEASNASAGDEFGYFDALSLSADGQTLAVGARQEDGNAFGIQQGDAQPGPQSDIAETSESENSGAVYVFTRTDAEGTSTWQQQAYLKAPNRDAGDYFGNSVRLNWDGSQLIVGAFYEDSPATGLEGDTGNDTEIAENTGAAYYYRRSGNTWLSPVYLKPSNAGPGRGGIFGGSVAISGDGETIAVSASAERGAATGMNGDQTSSQDRGPPTGAVYLY